jgi:hypothetical protein
MGFFSRTPQKNEQTLILHIGSGSVMGSIVANNGVLTTMRAFFSTPIPIVAELTLERFENEMNKALAQTITSLSNLHMGAPDRIVVYFASPWFASQVRIAKNARPTPFVVSHSTVNDMIARELKSFESEELNGQENTDTLRPIGSKVVQVLLDGKPHNDPIGMSAKELELSIFVSVAPEHTLRMIEDTIVRKYHASITFSSFLLASFVVTRDFFPHMHDWILVDIGGEVTDVSFVRNGALFQSVSFPHGSNFVLRKLSAGLGRSASESVSIFTLFMEDKIQESIKHICQSILDSAKKVWMQSFQSALQSISGGAPLPETLLLSVDSEITEFFTTMIEQENFDQDAHVKKPSKVIVLNGYLFHELLAFDTDVKRNTFMMIEALHATNQKI